MKAIWHGLLTGLALLLGLVEPSSARIVENSDGLAVWEANASKVKAEAYVERYLSIVFGKDAPSVAIHLLYEGRLELEDFYVNFYCRMRWGILTAPECDEWEMKRVLSPESFPSVYYAALRAHLPFVQPVSKCKAIPKRHSNASWTRAEQFGRWVFICRSNSAPVTLEVHYAASEDAADDFLIHLETVNSLPLSAIVGAPCEGLGIDPRLHELCVQFELQGENEKADDRSTAAGQVTLQNTRN